MIVRKLEGISVLIILLFDSFTDISIYIILPLPFLTHSSLFCIPSFFQQAPLLIFMN